MVGPLVDCPVHGILEDTGGGFSFAPGGGADLSGSWSMCPTCGRPAPVVDGSYAVSASGSRTANLRPTPDQARRLAATVAWAKAAYESGDADEEEVLSRVNDVVEAEVPWLSRLLPRLRRVPLSGQSGTLAAWLALIVGVLGFFGFSADGEEEVDSPPPAITDEQMRDLFEEYFGDDAPTTPPPPPPSTEAPTPPPAETPNG